METPKISPVIRSGIKIIENTIEGVTVKILDEEMSRSEPNELLPLGSLGVNADINWEGIGSRKAFLTAEFCEQMHSTYGDKIAEEFVLPMFGDEIKKINEQTYE